MQNTKNTNTNTIIYSEYKKIHTLRSKRKKKQDEKAPCDARPDLPSGFGRNNDPPGSKIASVSFSFSVMCGIDLTFAECLIVFSKSRGFSIALKQFTGENKWRAALVALAQWG